MRPLSRPVKITAWVAALVMLASVAAAAGGVWTVRRSFPQTEGTLDVPGLDAAVTVIRDSSGIPQLYADDSHDLFFAQGFVQAQDRFFEMDFRRHVTSGRLSEMFGRDALETDMVVRTMGWRDVAERELSLLEPQTRAYLEAFADGVNAYLADHQGSRLSLEYAVLDLGGLDYTPEEWSPADSLAWLKAMAWDLGGNMDDEVERSLDSAVLSNRQIDELFPAYPYASHSPIVTQGAVVDGIYEQDARRGGTRLPSRPAFPTLAAVRPLKNVRAAADSLREVLGAAGAGDGVGSNAWAVSGDHTASGAPILANDPHLAASMPSPWYQMGLHCTRVDSGCPFDVSGFTFAGLPGVVIGHNADIAWGFTNLNPDVQDLYLEKVSDDGTYLYRGRQRPLTTREESFGVKGEEDPVTITVRSTRHGPLISDVSATLSTVGADAPAPDAAPDRGDGYAVALRWTALTPGRTADALFGINTARNWDEFREAARTFVCPSQNLVYADSQGHIGYQAPGQIPLRRTGRGDWPVPGWDPAYEWDGTIPYDALPSVLDPDDGYVVTANQAVTTARYPYYLGDSFDYGFRSERIRDLLESDDSLTVEDMAGVQLDDYSALAKELTPYLQHLDLDSPFYAQGQRTLAGWDFHQGAGSGAAAYFNSVYRWTLERTFADQLPKDAMPTGGSRWWQVMLRLFANPRDEFWDDVSTTDVRETRDDILREAMTIARDELTNLQSRSPHEWQWGRLHTLTLRNATLGSEGSPVGFLFNRGGYELSGGPSVVNAASWDPSEGYEATAVPSMRMVVPLDDLDAARWINLAGASGHAYDSHYTDQTPLWVEGDVLPWVFTAGAVREAADDTLVLQPTG